MDKEQLLLFIERLKESKHLLMVKQSFMHEHNFPLERDNINEKVKTINVILDQLENLKHNGNANTCHFDFK